MHVILGKDEHAVQVATPAILGQARASADAAVTTAMTIGAEPLA